MREGKKRNFFISQEHITAPLQMKALEPLQMRAGVPGQNIGGAAPLGFESDSGEFGGYVIYPPSPDFRCGMPSFPLLWPRMQNESQTGNTGDTRLRGPRLGAGEPHDAFGLECREERLVESRNL